MSKVMALNLEILTGIEMEVVVRLSVQDNGLADSLSSLLLSNRRVGESCDEQQTTARQILGTVENRLPVFIIEQYVGRVVDTTKLRLGNLREIQSQRQRVAVPVTRSWCRPWCRLDRTRSRGKAR